MDPARDNNGQRAHKGHDRSQRLIFTHARAVRDLLASFVNDPCIAELDFSTLRRLPADFISSQLAGDFEERASDVVWQVNWRLQALYVVILLELQSTCPEEMALRMMVYVGLFYQRLLKEQPLLRAKKLPPVLPIVLYNGESKWSAPLEVRELIDVVPGRLEAYVPSMSYYLIDVKRWPRQQLEGLRNVVAGVFRIEQSHTPAELRRTVADLADWLEDPSLRDLRQAIAAWLCKVVLPARVPEAEIPEVKDLDEFKTILEASMQTWTEQWKAEGYNEGLQAGMMEGRQVGMTEGRQVGMTEGRQVGMTEGEAAILRRLIRRRFGRLDDSVKARINAADAKQLLKWADRILTARRVDDIFDA